MNGHADRRFRRREKKILKFSLRVTSRPLLHNAAMYVIATALSFIFFQTGFARRDRQGDNCAWSIARHESPFLSPDSTETCVRVLFV